MWIMAAVSTLTAAILSGTLLIRSHRESVRQQLQTAGASLISLGVSDFSELKDFEQFNNFIEDTLQMEKVDKIIRIFNPSGKLIFTTVGFGYDKLPDHVTPIKKPAFLTIEGEQRNYESLIIPYLEKRNRTFYLQITIPLPKYAQILKDYWWQSLLLLCLLMGISLVIARILATKLLQPVRTIADHLEKMDPQKIQNWKPLEVIKEGQYLFSITEGINLLMDRTRTALFQLRKMSRYVAHELRTPLTILQGEAETTLLKKTASKEEYENVLRSSLEEIQRMSGIITTVLQVGDPNHSGVIHSASLELTHWLLQNKPKWEKILGRPIQMDIGTVDQVLVFVDPKLLFRLVDNLVRNIEQHTPPLTQCTMSLKKSDQIVLTISDNGFGMPQDKIDSLNHEKSLSEATGVGLHFCFRIAELCGIYLSFANRKTGGLDVEIAFP